MKQVVDKYVRISLVVRILIGLVIGAVCALLCPKATAIGILGDVFVGALKAVAPVLVFFLVLSAISKAGAGIGARFRTVILLYMASTLLAALVAVAGSFLYSVKMVLTSAETEVAPPSGIAEVFRKLLTNMVTNPIEAISNANYMSVLFWAVILGLAFKLVASERTIEMMSDIAEAISMVVKWIIQCAPFGILGLVFRTVSENGLAIFKDYGKLVLLLVVCMLIVALVIDPLISATLLKRNPYPLVFTCLKESGITAFFTRSSGANIPVNMELCEKLGLDKDFYSVSIPLGATINMDGAAITITVMTLAVCHTLNIAVDIPTAIVLSILSTLAACGSSGVAGGSLLLIPMACSLFGIGNDIAMQAVGVGFIIGVIQDSVETALNSSGDVMFAATAEFHDRIKRQEEVSF